MAHPLNRYAHPLSRIEDKHATPESHQLDNNMNKDNAAQFLPLVKALAEGKTIQFNSTDVGWVDMYSPEFTSDASLYRIKPEPREWDAYTKGGLATFVNMSHMEGWGKIRVREILD